MELFVLLSMILLNGLFSLSEMAVVSARKVRLQQMADAGASGARIALDLAANPSRFLATVQVGITAIGILSGAYGEAALLDDLVPVIRQIPHLASHAEDISMVIIVVGITFFSLIMGELIPKRLAMHQPERVAILIAKPMNGLSLLTAPFIKLLSFTTDSLLNLVGVHHKEESPVTEEEINVLIKQGADAGVFEHHEQQLIKRVFQLDNRRITDIMTPRTEIDMLNFADSLEVNLKRVANSRYSRFPVCHCEQDQVIGILDTAVLLKKLLSQEPFDLAQLLIPPVFIPSTISIVSLMECFRRNKTYMVLVVDEFGGIAGAVTLTDLLEEMVGEMEATTNDEDQSVVIREDGSLLLDGLVDLERLRELTQLTTPFPNEDEGGYHTLAGLVMTILERIPKVGDFFVFGGFRFEVMDMDRNRVDRVMVCRVPEVTPTTEDNPCTLSGSTSVQ